jgi:phosphatidylinositol 4-kinase
LIFYL